MAQASARRLAFLAKNPMCIFCGGAAVATTVEHCPPRALFLNKAWPEGFEFSACADCNHGTSDDDLLVAALAGMQLTKRKPERASGKLLLLANRQFPTLIHRMLSRQSSTPTSVGEAGDRWRDSVLVNVTPEMHAAVATLAGKLTKAIFHRHTSKIFPKQGEILFHWLSNVDAGNDGRIPFLTEIGNHATLSGPIQRAGKSLKDQFDYSYFAHHTGDLYVMQVTFGSAFGFATIFSPTPGFLDEASATVSKEPGGEGWSQFWARLSDGTDPARDSA